MIRRCWLAVAGLSLALATGCGTMMMLATPSGEPFWLRHRLDWTVFQPSHRVALATFEALKAELAEVKIVDEELTTDDRYKTSDGKVPAPGEIKIPDDYPAFWVDGFIPDGPPMIVNCRSCVFRGKTKDGKRVDAVVRLEVVGKSEQHTVVSVQVGHKDKEDEKLTKELIDKISERVLAPRLAPGSAEERAALNLTLGRRPADEWNLDATLGLMRMKGR